MRMINTVRSSLSGRWQKSSNLAVVASSPSRYVILELSAEQPVVLEGTAARIWELLDQSGDVAFLVQALLPGFAGHETELLEQLQTFIAAMESRALLLWVGSCTNEGC